MKIIDLKIGDVVHTSYEQNQGTNPNYLTSIAVVIEIDPEVELTDIISLNFEGGDNGWTAVEDETTIIKYLFNYSYKTIDDIPEIRNEILLQNPEYSL